MITNLLLALIFLGPGIWLFIMAYRGVINHDATPVSIIFVVMGAVMIGFAVWLPFLGDQADKERAQFDLDCHARGGSVVETRNSGYECWTERIELDEPSVY